VRRDGSALVSDGVVAEVHGYTIRLGVLLREHRQMSDPIQLRPKAFHNRRDRMGRDAGESRFVDVNFNATWVLDNALRQQPHLKHLAHDAYVGLLTILLNEHERNRNLYVAGAAEHTVHGSSYRSIVFQFGAVPFVEITGPDGVRRDNTA
jgi:hypothetical protein